MAEVKVVVSHVKEMVKAAAAAAHEVHTNRSPEVDEALTHLKEKAKTKAADKAAKVKSKTPLKSKEPVAPKKAVHRSAIEPQPESHADPVL